MVTGILKYAKRICVAKIVWLHILTSEKMYHNNERMDSKEYSI